MAFLIFLPPNKIVLLSIGKNLNSAVRRNVRGR
jgi:hypothetical protein